jgi:L,D-peptidoglycan transpeptidase YkuD (ErfK/YbiS/YcfS/YnhG family)
VPIRQGTDVDGGGNKRKAAIVLVTVAALTASGALVAPAEAATPATPGRIDTLRGTTRAIVVFSWSWRTTRAVLRTYERARPGDRWRLVRGPMPARIGYNRFSANRREGDGTTPAGTYGESLWRNRRVAYRYAAVIDFNYRRPVYKKGSGIFLPGQTGGPTAGCVSLRPKDLLAVLGWLRPGTRIAMGPAGYLNNL